MKVPNLEGQLKFDKTFGTQKIHRTKRKTKW